VSIGYRTGVANPAAGHWVARQSWLVETRLVGSPLYSRARSTLSWER